MLLPYPHPTYTPKQGEKPMMTGRISNHNYKLMLELLKKQMEERKVKEIEKSGDKDINKKT